MKIAIAAEKLGFPLKEVIKSHLIEKGHEVADMGTLDLEHNIPYPFGADNVAKAIQNGEAECGFLFCGTGMGMSISANKHKGVYCALVESQWAARKSRLVNDANILAMGASIVGSTMARDIVDTFLETEFAGNEPPERREILSGFLEQLKGVEAEVFKE